MAGSTAPSASSDSKAAFSILQPDSPTGLPGQGSYLRLGSYEASSITHQFTANISTTLSSTASDLNANADSGKDGFILYTSQDLLENVIGAGWKQFGSGHTVEVMSNDADVKVHDGMYHLYARDAVTISVGQDDSTNDKTSSGTHIAADVQINATGRIIQTTYGSFNKTTIGPKTETTKDVATKVFVLHKSSLLAKLNVSLTFGIYSHITFGSSIAISAGPALSIYALGYIHQWQSSGTDIIRGKHVGRYLGSYTSTVRLNRTETILLRNSEKVIGSWSSRALRDNELVAANIFKKNFETEKTAKTYDSNTVVSHDIIAKQARTSETAKLFSENATIKTATHTNVNIETDGKYYNTGRNCSEIGKAYHILNNEIVMFR